MNVHTTIENSGVDLFPNSIGDRISASTRGIDAVLIPAAAIQRKVTSLGEEGALGGIALKQIQVWFFLDNSCVVYNDQLREAFHIYGAIYKKWRILGGMEWGIPCSDERGTPDGVGRFVAFNNHEAAIYWTPETGANGIWGPVRAKWADMGWETSPLGYPVVDTRPTPDGLGQFSLFSKGAIYSTDETGARAVLGTIYDHWARMGSERSYLGYPTSDESPFPDGGWTSEFQNGSIYCWADTGAIDLGDVVVHYTGLYCYGETDVDGFSTSDEPYVIISRFSAQGAVTSRSVIYDDVEPGEARPDHIEIYRGRPYGLTIGTVLMEHSNGDPDRHETVVRDAVLTAYQAGIDVVKDVFGAAVANFLKYWLNKVMPDVAGWIGGALGLDDRQIDSATTVLSAKNMVLLAARAPNLERHGIVFKVESHLLSGWGASYKAHYGIVPA
jgi:hypothetical protein